MRSLDVNLGGFEERQQNIWVFRRGDIIVQAQPFAAALQPQLAGKFCDECMQP